MKCYENKCEGGKRMRIKKLLYIVSAFFIIFISCEEKVLDTKPSTEYTDKDVWSDINLAKLFALDQYRVLEGFGISDVNWGAGIMMLGTICDETYNKWDIVECVNQGYISAEDPGWIFWDLWRHYWWYVRNANMVLENIDQVENASPDEINIIKGEMKFVRAYAYFRLISYYGGVPIIKETFDLDDDFTRERNSFKACVDFILEDLDDAVNLVPLDADFGRITKGACLALKSRVLLYAASKLHDPSVTSDSLFVYDKPNKWQDAADAAMEVINLNKYSLVPVNSWKEYQELFLSNNEEVILARPFHPEYGYFEYRPDLLNSPNGYGGWACNTPTQNIVNDYELIDGTIPEFPDSGKGVDPDSLYANRDPRFYANILYNGSEFRGRKVEGFLPGGKDSKDGPAGWNWSRTGYWMRKFMDESIDFSSTRGNTPRIHFRLAEIYLNLAEALYHLGEEGEAREYVNMIRRRVGMPEISSSGPELLDAIRHEREIELMFEGHRFFDLRRWMTAPEELSEPCYGVVWEKLDENGNLSESGTLCFRVYKVADRLWDDKLYYMPIPFEEIAKTGMRQNPGY